VERERGRLGGDLSEQGRKRGGEFPIVGVFALSGIFFRQERGKGSGGRTPRLGGGRRGKSIDSLSALKREGESLLR